MQSVYRGPELRAWQVEAIETWDKHKIGIIQAVPGAGKTILAIKMLCAKLEENPKLKVLIVCPRLTLIEQWIEGILENSSIKRSDIYEVSSNNESRAYVCAQDKIFDFKVFISTFHQIKQFFNECKWKDHDWFLIVDEMHNTTENYKFPNAPIKYKLGLSATPRKRGKDADFNLGGIVYTYAFHRALQDKIILDPVIKIVFYSVNKQLFKKIQNEGDATTDLVESAYDDFLPDEEMLNEHKAFVEHQKQLSGKEKGEEESAPDARTEEPDVFTSKNTDFLGIQRILENQFHIGKPDSVQTLVFVNRIKKADLLNQMLAEKFSAKVSHSYHSKSAKYNTKNHFNDLKRQFADGSFNVLISVGTLGEGIDFPYASHGIIASPIYNPTSFVQKVGRLLRSYKDHKKATIYYYVPSELITRLLTDEKIEPNYFKSVIKIADENKDLYFVDRKSLTEERGSLSELLIQGAAYERNEDIRRIKIPHDLDSIMRFFKRVYPSNLKDWKRFYIDQIEEQESEKKKDAKKTAIINDPFKGKKNVDNKALAKRAISEEDLENELDEALEEPKPQKEIDFTPLRNELAKNHKILLASAENLQTNLGSILLMQKKFAGKKFADFESVKAFVKEGLKLKIITKIKYGAELENISKEESTLSPSEQDMLRNAVSAELGDFSSKEKELQKAIVTLSGAKKLIEKHINAKAPSAAKANSQNSEVVKDRISGMTRIAKTFFDLQSLFLDELELSELAKNTASKEQKFFLTIGKDIFLTKVLARKFSYPEDFGLSRWREEKELPKVVIHLSPIEKFCKRLMFLMSNTEGNSVCAIDDWQILKQSICSDIHCTLLNDDNILKELEKHKFEKEFSFEKLFFVSEAIKRQKKK
ncbi:MAG: DEAD/DEAH box helicase family protein [archaeon]